MEREGIQDAGSQMQLLDSIESENYWYTNLRNLKAVLKLLFSLMPN
jgi:hypothetical protein